MFSKVIIAGLIGTGVIGTGGVSAVAPVGVEITAGPLHIEGGNGKGFIAQFNEPAPVTFTILMKDDRQLQIKF